MGKKDLIQRMGSNVGSFILGAALAIGINYVTQGQPVPQQIASQTKQMGYWDHNISNWIPPETATYKVHRRYDGRLSMGYVGIDTNRDGDYDLLVKFQHKTPPEENPNFWTPSTIGLYERSGCGNEKLSIEGFPAYNVVGRMVKRHTAERGISNEQFKKEAQMFFKENGLDFRVLGKEIF